MVTPGEVVTVTEGDDVSCTCIETLSPLVCYRYVFVDSERTSNPGLLASYRLGLILSVILYVINISQKTFFITLEAIEKVA